MNNPKTPTASGSMDRLVRSYIQMEASVYEIQEAKRKMSKQVAAMMKAEREARGISQADFARAMGCTPAVLCYMEDDDNRRTYDGKWALSAANALAEFDSANTEANPRRETASG